MTTSDGGLHLERNGDDVILKSTFSGYPVIGVFLLGVFGFTLMKVVGNVAGAGAIERMAQLLGATLFCFIGSFFAFPPVTTTVFKLSSRRVTHNVSYFEGLHENHRVCSFDEIEGLAINECQNEGLSYRPMLLLRDGTTIGLCAVHATGRQRLALERTLNEACAATNLPNLNVRPA